MSSTVEQMLKRWKQDGTVLNMELSSKYISVMSKSVVVRAFQDNMLILDIGDCAFKILLSEATVNSREVESNAIRFPDNEQLLNQINILFVDNQEVLLTEVRRLPLAQAEPVPG